MKPVGAQSLLALTGLLHFPLQQLAQYPAVPEMDLFLEVTWFLVELPRPTAHLVESGLTSVAVPGESS